MKKQILLLLAMLPILSWAQSNSNPYGIYPVPHVTEVQRSSANVTADVNIIAEEGIDVYTRNRAVQVLEEHGKKPVFVEAEVKGVTTLRLGVHGSGGAVDAVAPALSGKGELFTLEKYDRHYIAVSSQDGNSVANILIVGENTDATFYGLASLEQMLDNNSSAIQCGTIRDYADVKDRGVIEGYYGVPYSAEVTKDLFRFMARYKMNMYMYGAKSDPYHSQKWGDPYPTSITEEQRSLGYLSQSMLRDITDVAHQCKVNFIWAIHPGTAFTNSGNTTVISSIMTKFESMYKLGVRQFGVFVDDVGVPTDAATLKLNADRVTELQGLIDNKWNKAGAAPADTVKPLNFVPQLYALSWASAENCKKFYNALSSTPSKVNIYITGWGVWTVPNSSDLALAKSYLGREVSWWWNYPCNDNDVTKLFPMDTYSNFADETNISNSARLDGGLQGAKTIISNPMQQGEVSKIALFSIGDYAWNNAAFDNKASWEASLPAVVGKQRAEALRTLAPYLRYYDSSAFSGISNRAKTAMNNGEGATEELVTEMEGILAACASIREMETSDSESDRLFYDDLRPWLLKLEAMAQEILNLAKVSAMPSDDDAKWEAYVEELNAVEALGTDNRFTFNILSGLGSGISLSTRRAQPSQQTMAPFVEWMRDNALGKGYFHNLNVSRPEFVASSAETKGSATYYSSSGSAFIQTTNAATLQPGDYVGISLVQATRLADIAIADTLFDRYQLMYSANGKRWTRLEKGVVPPTHVKYVVAVNTSSEVRTMAVSRSNFTLYLPLPIKAKSASVPQSEDGFYENHSEKYMFDGDYTTYTCIKRNQQNGDAYTLTLKEPTVIHDVRICMGTTNDDYMTAGRVQISEDGTTWRTLNIMGSSTNNYNLANKKNVKYSDEMTYCDFDAKGQTALYVRLYVSTANTSKWLRLYEIDVNALHYAESMQGRAVDATGMTIATLTDAKGATFYQPASMTKAGEVTYHLRSLNQAKSVSVYRGGNAETDARVSVSLNGESWEDVGSLAGYVTHIDLSSRPFAVAVKISWTSKAPLIYEISEQTDDNAPVSPTGIMEIALSNNLQSDNSQFIYDLQGRRVKSSNSKLSNSQIKGLSNRQIPPGVYIIDGRKAILR